MIYRVRLIGNCISSRRICIIEGLTGSDAGNILLIGNIQIQGACFAVQSSYPNIELGAAAGVNRRNQLNRRATYATRSDGEIRSVHMLNRFAEGYSESNLIGICCFISGGLAHDTGNRRRRQQSIVWQRRQR